jgi:hypothetical protein
MVEMALVLPILLMILLGILDFGRALNYWNDVNQMAADGARFAAVNRNPGAAVPAGVSCAGSPTGALSLQEWLKRQAVTPELRCGISTSVSSPIEVCIRSEAVGGTLNAGDPVTVIVRSKFNLVPLVDGEDGITTMNVRGSATMRLEQAATNFSADAGCA